LRILPFIKRNTTHHHQMSTETKRIGFSKWLASRALPATSVQDPFLPSPKRMKCAETSLDIIIGTHPTTVLPSSFVPTPLPLAPSASSPAIVESHQPMNEDDVDELDAFMANITQVAQRDKEEALVKAAAQVHHIVNLPTEQQAPVVLVEVPKEVPKISEVVKELYIEVPELANKSPSALSELRASLDGMKIRGVSVAPISSFSQSGLSPKLLEAMKLMGFLYPTPIQAQVRLFLPSPFFFDQSGT